MNTISSVIISIQPRSNIEINVRRRMSTRCRIILPKWLKAIVGHRLYGGHWTTVASSARRFFEFSRGANPIKRKSYNVVFGSSSCSNQMPES